MFITIDPHGELIRHDGRANADAVRAQVGPPGFDIVRIRAAEPAGRGRESLCAFVNDEGFSQGLARNPVGACVIASLGAVAHIYAGMIVITGWDPYANGTEITDLTVEQVTQIEQIHRSVQDVLGEDVPDGAPTPAFLDYAEHVLTAPAPSLTWTVL